MNRMASAALSVVLLYGIAPSALSESLEPEQDPLTRSGVTRAAFCLWSTTSFGQSREEAAAWIVAGEDGSVALHPWPRTGRTHHAVFKGRPPNGALGIVHTHPSADSPRPSRRDQETAKEIGLPVATLSRDGIWIALPRGDVVRSADRRWFAPFRAPGVCEGGLEARSPHRANAPEAVVTSRIPEAPDATAAGAEARASGRGSWRTE